MIRRALLALLGIDTSPPDHQPTPPTDPAPASSGSGAVSVSAPTDPISPRSQTLTTVDKPVTSDNLVVVGDHGERYRLVRRSHGNGIDTLVLAREDGCEITVPLSELTWQGAGTWLLSDAVRDARGLVIPVVEERLKVSRGRVETGRVRVNKAVESRDVVVDDALKRERVRVEHVPINQVITGAVPQVREQGDVTVIPILEERLVTRTELVLVEEVHIHREQTEYHDPQSITLRKEVVTVERLEGDQLRPANG
jgi:uncharacterized protein (TIGR02271 family)